MSADFPVYIPDGYTRKSFVQARFSDPGVGVRFTHRPILRRKQVEILKAYAELDVVQVFEKTSPVLFKQIESWNLVDDKGKPLPLEFKYFLQIEGNTLNRMLEVLAGLVPSDLDPEDSANDQASQSTSEFEAMLAGSPAPVAAAEADEKN